MDKYSDGLYIKKNGILKKIASTVRNISLTNNLLATEEGTALDATQGKILADMIAQGGGGGALKKVWDCGGTPTQLVYATWSTFNITESIENCSEILIAYKQGYTTNATDIKEIPIDMLGSVDTFAFGGPSYMVFVDKVSNTQIRMKTNDKNNSLKEYIYSIYAR